MFKALFLLALLSISFAQISVSGNLPSADEALNQAQNAAADNSQAAQDAVANNLDAAANVINDNAQAAQDAANSALASAQSAAGDSAQALNDAAASIANDASQAAAANNDAVQNAIGNAAAGDLNAAAQDAQNVIANASSDVQGSISDNAAVIADNAAAVAAANGLDAEDADQFLDQLRSIEEVILGYGGEGLILNIEDDLVNDYEILLNYQRISLDNNDWVLEWVDKSGNNYDVINENGEYYVAGPEGNEPIAQKLGLPADILESLSQQAVAAANTAGGPSQDQVNTIANELASQAAANGISVNVNGAN